MKNMLRKFLGFGIYASSGDGKGEKLEANWGAFIGLALVNLVFLAIIEGLFPNAIPYKTWDLWSTKGSIAEWASSAWPIFAWAGGLTLFVSLFTSNSKRQNDNAEEFWAKGLWVSLRAGVMEEIIFRWLLFMLALAMIPLFDWILGGCLFGHGLVWLFNHYILIPLANFFTFGAFSHLLTRADSWIFASAILSANARFRDGHKYQGPIGMINSWVIGLFMFNLMFKFGLVAAIAVHFLYDAMIFTIQYLDRVQERARGVHGPDNSEE